MMFVSTGNSRLRLYTKPITFLLIACVSICCNAVSSSSNLSSGSRSSLYLPIATPQTLAGRTINPEQMLKAAANASHLVNRGSSQDPSCPNGFLCVLEACPSGIECQPGDSCVNFEGTTACRSSGLQVCALNPSTFEAVVCHTGGQCCHGNCYSSDAVCCDFPTIQCTVGELCNACNPGETCGNNQCVGSGGQSSHSITTSKSTSVLVTSSHSIATSKSTSVLVTSSHSITTSKSSSHTSSSSAPSPTVVPSVGTFDNIGCYADSPDARVLTNGSSTDFSSNGMTVGKCTALAKGYQFAGVEYSGECYWGNFATYNTSESLGDCNAFCDGDVSQVCGGGNRILIYQDAEWVLLTNAEFAAQLQELQSLLQQLQVLIRKWQQDLQTYYTALQAAIQKRRRRDLGSLNQLGSTVNLDQQDILALIKPQRIQTLNLKINLYLEYKVNQAQTAALEAADIYEQASNTVETVAEQLSSPDLTISVIEDGVIPVAADVAEVAGIVSSGTAITTAVGAPELIVGGIVVAAATGLFATLGTVLSIFLGTGGGGGGGQPPPTSAVASTTTSSSPTSSATASRYLIVAKVGASQLAFESFVSTLPKRSDDIDITYSQTQAFAHVATLNDTEVKSVKGNSVVGSVTLNKVLLGDSNPLILTKRRPQEPPAQGASPIAQGSGNEKKEAKRALSNQLSPLFSSLVKQTTLFFRDSTFASHLQQLSATWFDNSLSPYNGKDFLFEAAGGSGTVIYIVDDGIETSHPEFASQPNIVKYVALDQNPAAVVGDHGTCVASMAVGKNVGVLPNAVLVNVQVNLGSWASIYDGLNWVFQDILNNNRQGKAVINMSWGGFYSTTQATTDADLRGDFLFPIMNQFIAIGVVPVIAAGNEGDNQGQPISLKNLFTQIRPAAISTIVDGLISVGAVENDGSRSSFTPKCDISDSTASCMTAFAQGTDNYCAVLGGQYQNKDGTSFAAPIVSGLAAYFLAHPSSEVQQFIIRSGAGGIAPQISSLIQQWSYQRKIYPNLPQGSPFTPNVAWNGAILNEANVPTTP